MSMIVTTVATLPSVSQPAPPMERATLLAMLDTNATAFPLTVLAMMMSTRVTPQIPVLLQLLQTNFNSTKVALHLAGLVVFQIFRPT